MSKKTSQLFKLFHARSLTKQDSSLCRLNLIRHFREVMSVA
ncbi:MAG: hypothetical protein V3U88_05840 [Methylococcales bacterium]